MADRARVLLIGMGPTTESALTGLLSVFDVVGLVRRADRDDAALQLARRAGVPVESDISLDSVRNAIDDADPDCVAVSSYHRILPPQLIESRPFVNVHYAPLPRYRGRATVNWAIINGETSTAITVHELLPALDAGGILVQEAVPIGPRDTVTDVYRRLNDIQVHALPLAITRLLAADHGAPQDEAHATYACTRVPADGEIDWTKSAVEIDRLVRALTPPFPGAYTWLRREKLVINRAEPVVHVVYEGVVPGRIVAIERDAGTVDVLTGSGVLRLAEILVDDRPESPPHVIRSLGDTLGSDATALTWQMLELHRSDVLTPTQRERAS